VIIDKARDLRWSVAVRLAPINVGAAQHLHEAAWHNKRPIVLKGLLESIASSSDIFLLKHARIYQPA
jgi:hypothetical protein